MSWNWRRDFQVWCFTCQNWMISGAYRQQNGCPSAFTRRISRPAVLLNMKSRGCLPPLHNKTLHPLVPLVDSRAFADWNTIIPVSWHNQIWLLMVSLYKKSLLPSRNKIWLSPMSLHKKMQLNLATFLVQKFPTTQLGREFRTSRRTTSK